MPETTETPKDTAAPKAAPKTAAPAAKTNYTRESVENLAKVQHVVADYVAAQSELAGTYVKERLELKKTSPGTAAIDAAVEGVEQMTEAQKNLVDWAIAGRAKAAKTDTARKDRARLPQVPFRGLLHRGIETMLDGQQELIGLARAQGNLAIDGFAPLAAGKFSAIPGTFLELAGKAVDNAIASQEKLLDLTTGYTNEARTMLTDGERPALEKETADALQNGTEATVGMQKKLLGIAAEQTHATLGRVATGSESFGEPVESRVLDSARKGVDRVTETQQKMLDRSREWVDRAFAN